MIDPDRYQLCDEEGYNPRSIPDTPSIDDQVFNSIAPQVSFGDEAITVTFDSKAMLMINEYKRLAENDHKGAITGIKDPQLEFLKKLIFNTVLDLTDDDYGN